MTKPAILIVEDNADTQKLLVRGFTQLGCDVADVGSAEAARERLRGNGLFNVIILDFQLPGMDGPTFLREITSDQRLKNIPVVPFTSLLASGHQYDSELVNDWAGYSATEHARKFGTPVVSKEGDPPEVLPADLLMAVGFAIRNQGIPLPEPFGQVFSTLVRNMLGSEKRTGT